MLLSIANTLPRNIETSRADELIPSYFKTDASKFLDLLHGYYDYLNSEGLPSAEINAINTLRDIDNVSLKYFDQIQNLIGKTVPNSRVMDRVELYKIVIKYYNDRGSEDSVHTFFKIFFNEVVSLFYPKDFLFDLSGGTWDKDAEEYTANKSFLSNKFKIADGYYWQDYSYVIRTDIDSEEWLNEYLQFVHPAGLKLFAAIVIEIALRNAWYEDLDYTTRAVDEYKKEKWLEALIPPYITNRSRAAYHTPRSQPGWLRDQFLRFLFVYLRPENEDLLRTVILAYHIIAGGGAIDVRNSYVRNQYQREEKFLDTCVLSEGWLTKTVGGAIEEYSNANLCRMLNISTIIDIRTTYEMSFFNNDAQSTQVDWDNSEIDTDAQSTQVDWDSSSYEEIEV